MIDRVDVHPGSGRQAIVRDYKSGARRDEWQGARWRTDSQLQVALYMLAVRQLMGLEPVAGLYQPLGGNDLRGRGYICGTPAWEIGSWPPTLGSRPSSTMSSTTPRPGRSS